MKFLFASKKVVISLLLATVLPISFNACKHKPEDVPKGASQINAKFWSHRTATTRSIYYPDGKIYLKGELKAGLADGLWQYFSHTGQVTTSGYYKKSLRNGRWLFYNTNKKQYMQIDYAAVPKRTDYLLLSGNKVGNENGVYKRHYENGVLEEQGYYIGGSLHGIITHYYPNKQLAYKGSYIKDKKNGLWLYYFPDGIIKRKEHYKDGELHGPLINYYPNAKLYNTSNWYLNELVGSYKIFRNKD